MSNSTNTILLERAAACIDYFQDKLPAKVIERDIDYNDLEALAQHVHEAEAEISRQEFYNNDSY